MLVTQLSIHGMNTMIKKCLIAIAILLFVLMGITTSYLLYLELNNDTGSHDIALDSTESKPDKKDALFFSLYPAFVTNYGQGRESGIVQFTLDVMARDQETLDQVEKNQPIIRNNILIQASSMDRSVMQTVEGKEHLRLKLLGVINTILVDEIGVEPIEAVYFTKFVTQ